MEKAKEAGARKVMELKTSGPFHTEKLEVAAEKLKEELKKIDISFNKEFKVIKNIDGMAYGENDDIREILSKHVMSPVRFKKCIESMIELGVDTFIEVGPREGFIRICEKSKQGC